MTTQQGIYPGQLDQTFGIDGVVSVQAPGYAWLRIESLKSVGLGPGRKIYFAGWCENELDPPSLFVLGRLNSDGTPDTAFGIEGLVTGQFAGLESQAQALALQDDGKILLFGKARSSERLAPAAFARFESDGTLDKSFGTAGYTVLQIVLTPPIPTADPSTTEETVSPSGVEILPDGKILAFKNYTFLEGTRAMGLIIRLDKDGALDLDFNQIGYIGVVHPDFRLQASYVLNIMVQADGKYLACGAGVDDVRPQSAMFVRYSTEGKLDHSFGKAGFVVIQDTKIDGERYLVQMVQQPDQRILGIGSALLHCAGMGMLVSIEADGTPNLQFNAGAPLYTHLKPGALTLWSGGAIQQDGKIVVAGGLGLPNGEVDIIVARFTDAAFDPAFNNGQGWVATHIREGTEAATALDLQDDGKILVSAYTEIINGVILRYVA